MGLTIPDSSRAEQCARTVGEYEGLIGTIMSPSTGGRAVTLRSIAQVDHFLEERTIEDFAAANYRLDVHYVDFGALSEWLEAVIGDAELAAGVLALHDTGRPFGHLVPQVKALLKERLEQCESVMTATAS